MRRTKKKSYVMTITKGYCPVIKNETWDGKAYMEPTVLPKVPEGRKYIAKTLKKAKAFVEAIRTDGGNAVISEVVA